MKFVERLKKRIKRKPEFDILVTENAPRQYSINSFEKKIYLKKATIDCNNKTFYYGQLF